MTISGVGGSAWYARALDALSARDENVAREPGSTGGPGHLEATRGDQAGASLDEVTSSRAQSNLAVLATSLGTDPATLLAQITSGQDVRSLLSRTSDAGYGTSIAKSTTGGIAIDQYA